MSVPDDLRLAKLVSLWQRCRAEGKPVSAGELCQDSPELLSELQRRLAALERMESLAAASSETADFAAADSRLQTAPESPLDPSGWPVIPGYEIQSQLGRGGMGVVYQARDVHLNRLVAIKMVLSGAPSSPESLGRFRAEAEAIARLQHPHVVQVFSWSEHKGLPYLVMEYVAGGGLDRRVAGRPQPPADAARLVLLLARAVHAAHKAGVIHRDLKPANILLAPAADEPALNTSHGWPKVSDFGLARLSGGGEAQTASYGVLGTPSYMAPEQAAGKVREIGPATDVYALGAILYELLTGRPPFKGESLLETLDQVRSLPVRPPGRLAATVPPALEAICLRCLEKAPADRYPTAQALAEDLAAMLDAAAGSTTTEELGRTTSLPGVAQPLHRKSRRFRSAVLASMALAGVLLAVVGTILWPRILGRWATTDPVPVAGPSGASSPAVATPSPSYTGQVDVLLWRTGKGKSLRLRLTDEGALPLQDGDQFRIEARVTPAAYVYLFGIDTEGEVTPIYPWKPAAGWGSRPPGESPREVLSLPDAQDKGWSFEGGKEGMETFLLLARSTPLDSSDAEVRGWFTSLGAQRPVPDARSAVWLDNGRIVEDDPRRLRAFYKERQLDDPLVRLQRLIGERLQPHAEFTTAVSFTRQGKQ